VRLRAWPDGRRRLDLMSECCPGDVRAYWGRGTVELNSAARALSSEQIWKALFRQRIVGWVRNLLDPLARRWHPACRVGRCPARRVGAARYGIQRTACWGWGSMARLGPLFRSAQDLVTELGVQGLRGLPGPPLPVQLQLGEDDAVTISLLVTLPAGIPAVTHAS
jgi:hypothetical protein